MIIKSGLLQGTECISVFDVNANGAFSGSNCPAASESVQDWCSCVGEGEAVKQCIPQEDGDFPCDPNDLTDVCCVGTCKFRLSEFDFVCTQKPAQPVHPTYNPPGPPAPAPTPVATPSPVFAWQPIPRPTGYGFFQTPPGVDECAPGQGCESTNMKCAFIGGEYSSYKCISTNASNKEKYSLSGGGGAGATAKQGGV
jgi:hypothetical protein